jgi:hypothetical protein
MGNPDNVNIDARIVGRVDLIGDETLILFKLNDLYGFKNWTHFKAYKLDMPTSHNRRKIKMPKKRTIIGSESAVRYNENQRD